MHPIAEYNSVIWSPVAKHDIEPVEKVQRRFTKRLRGLRIRNLSDCDRLTKLGLCSLELRRLYLDLLYCYKIVFRLVNANFGDFIVLSDHHHFIFRKRYRPGGSETICPAPRRWQFDGGTNLGGSTSVRGRIRSPHISDDRRWLSCRQPACCKEIRVPPKINGTSLCNFAPNSVFPLVPSTHSLIPRLQPPFSANPSHRSLPFLLRD